MGQKKAALLSVSNKSGIIPFARSLIELGFTILCTSGSGKLLKEENIPFTSLEDYTGQKEILGGRVKTLHPRVHAGILAKRSDPAHMQELLQSDILPIEVVAVNLYPFEEHRGGENAGNPEAMIEQVDIGGPTMIRAAAKNFKYVYPVIDPQDYPAVIEGLRDTDSRVSRSLRLHMAQRVFAQLAQYNLSIAEYFSYVSLSESDDLEIDLKQAREESFQLGRYAGFVGYAPEALRYGENPHQSARFYTSLQTSTESWEQLQGKQLSFNNLLDADSCVSLLHRLSTKTERVSVIMKHLNPCGAAFAGSDFDAVQKAKQCDKRSHFGGIFGFTDAVTLEAAQEVVADFAEIVVAPQFDSAALKLFETKKNLRVLRVPKLLKDRKIVEVRSALGGVLFQRGDLESSDISGAELVAGETLNGNQLRDLEFAWELCAGIRSNAIALVKDGMLIGVGAGQMSRIDSVELAIWKAREHGHDISGAVAASDAFFPFSDNIERLANAGVRAVLSPRGSLKDQEVIEAAGNFGVALYFVSDRHFRH